MTGRDAHGRLRAGHSGNPGGRASRNSEFREKWLDRPVPLDALAELGLAEVLLSQLPEGCTYREVIAARTVFEAAMGGQGLTEANVRLWPLPPPSLASRTCGLPSIRSRRAAGVSFALA